MVKVVCRKRRLVGAVGMGLIVLAPGPWAPSEARETASMWASNAAVLAHQDPAAGARPSPSKLEPTGVEVGFPEGLPGAASALAVGDFARAISLSTFDVPPEQDSEAWVWVGVLRGRALRGLGRAEEAVIELTPRWASKNASRFFPLEILAMELARGKLDWAATLEPGQADKERKDAIRILDRVRRLDDVRNLAELRVLQAEAMLAMQGTSPSKTAALARSAVAAVQRILTDYPNHPRYGELWLAKARAMVRAGRATDAAEELRSIYILRAGEPESESAWNELQTLSRTQSRVRLRPLTSSESITRAVAARNLRWVDLSRQILDTVIDDPTTPSYLVDDARSQRSWTTYKQRDFRQCAEDLRPVFARSPTSDHRDRLLRCLERGEMYTEGLEIWAAQAKTKRKSQRVVAQWEATQLAYRAGRYDEALTWLKAYEKDSKAHAQERAWLHAWLQMRLGRNDEAIEAFERAERYAAERTRARYFRGKLLLDHADSNKQAQGERLLAALVQNDPYGYYGLAARQRLLDAGREAPAIPMIEPMGDEAVHPTRLETQAVFDELDEQFGDGWSALRRGRQLYAAGYLEEARRELRILVESFLLKGGRTGGVRNESFIVGLGWRSSWSYPQFKLSKAARADVRRPEAHEALRVGLRELARGLDEPYRYIRLSTPEDGHWKARWQPRAFRWALEREARLQNIDPIHLWSLMYTESRFRRFVVSPVGARGALQVMPWTGRQLSERLGEFGGSFDADSLFDIDTNAHLSAYYVAELLRKFHGQAPMAYASYNGGPSNVSRWLKAKASGGTSPLQMDVFIEEMVFQESYRYAKRVMEVSAVYSLLYGDGVPRWNNTVDPSFEDNIDF